MTLRVRTDKSNRRGTIHVLPVMGLDIGIFRLLASLVERIMESGTAVTMKTKTISILIYSLLVSTLAAGQVFAQVYHSPEAPGATGQPGDIISMAGKYQNYIYGIVKKIGKDQIILDKTRFGDGQVFRLERKTKFIDNGKRSTLAQLKVGDMVWIDAKIKKKTNEKIAKKVVTGVGPKAVSQQTF
jgi:hypothetical protein